MISFLKKEIFQELHLLIHSNTLKFNSLLKNKKINVKKDKIKYEKKTERIKETSQEKKEFQKKKSSFIF